MATPDTSAWSGLTVGAPLSGGHRSAVWEGRLRGERVVLRRSRRPADSLAWELTLMDTLDDAGFIVPVVRPADDGRRSVAGLVVQTWVEGRAPESEDDWHAVAAELGRLHAATANHPQRPGCVVVSELGTARRSLDADLDAMPRDVVDRLLDVFATASTGLVAVIHGDTHAGNIRITPDGRVGFVDWDESRVGSVWHDLSDLGVQVLDDETHRLAQRLSHAWEAANAWGLEPAYAARRLAQLD